MTDPPPAPRGWWRRVLTDLTPLRDHPAYRRLYFGQTVSLAGTQLTAVAVPVQVYDLTGSSFAVGLLGLAAVGPLVVCGLYGGAVADAVDRRRLALVTSGGLAVLALVLLVQALVDLDSVALLYLVVGLQAGLTGLNSPARRAMVPRLIPTSLLPAAGALDVLGLNLALTLGPLLAGLLLAGPGLATVYAVDAVSFVAALYGLARLPPMPPLVAGTRASLASVLEGFRFLRAQPVVTMTFAADLVAMVFGMPRALFPALAEGTFHAGPEAVGYLYSAMAAGALVGTVFGGWFGRVRRQGLAVLVSVGVYGVAILAFGLAPLLPVAFLLLALAGAADAVSAVFRSAILQAATPDEMRGRLQGVFIVVVAGGPRLGDVEAGTVAALVSPRFAVVAGGAAVVGGVAVLGRLAPAFRRYQPVA